MRELTEFIPLRPSWREEHRSAVDLRVGLIRPTSPPVPDTILVRFPRPF